MSTLAVYSSLSSVCLQSGRTPSSSAFNLENTFKVTKTEKPAHLNLCSANVPVHHKNA